MQWARSRFSTLISGAIIGFIGFVFVVSGVFNPKSTRGLHEGAVAGTVDGEPISISEFNRSLNQRMEMFKNFGGGKFSEEQLKQFRVKEGVFQELVRRKVMIQEAKRQGLEASDEEVKERIREIPAFQKDGKFDVAAYKQTLEANNYTASGFERMVREDVSSQAWQGYFQSRVHVSEGEIKRQYEIDNDKRDIKYVLLTSESGKQALAVSPEEVKKYLAETAKANLVKSQYDSRKDTEYKGQAFDVVKEKIARDLVASEKQDEIRKLNEKLADEVVNVLTADKSSDSKVNAMLKVHHIQVKKTGPVTRSTGHLPGIGEGKELIADAFAVKSVIDPTLGGKAKKYVLANGILVAIVADSTKPDLTKLETERGNVLRQIASRKQREIYEQWLKKVQANAKVDPNPAVVGDEAG